MNYVNIDLTNLQEFEYEKTAISDKEIIGTCELGNARFKLLNNSNEYSNYKNKWIQTIHGSFFIYDVKPVQERINIELNCYDIKYKLDTKYDSSLYTWPMTLKEWRNSIFTNCDVQFDNSDFPNSNLLLNEEPYIGNNPSNRNVICQIAKAGCSFVDTEIDKFYFKWFDNTTYTIDDWLDLTTEEQPSDAFNEVVLGRGDAEDNVCWPEETPQEPVIFRIDNNYILDPQDTSSSEDRRYSVIQPIYNRVNGFSYLIFSMRTQNVDNKLSINLGNKINYINIWGNSLTAYVMTKKITWLGGDFTDDDNYEITLSAEEIKESSTDLSYAAKFEEELLKVSRKADKNAGKIEDLVYKQTELTTEVAELEISSDEITATVANVQNKANENSNTIEQQSEEITSIKENIKGLQIDTQKTGGNNLLLNAIGNFGTNNWETVAMPYTDTYIQNKTGQNSCWLMNSGSHKQTVSVKNGIYTFNFLFEKIVSTAEIILKINEIEYSLEENNSFVINVTTNLITVEFISDTDESAYLMNLMLYEGELSQPYSNNANETITSSTKIGDGVFTLESSTMNTIFEAKPDGTRIKNKTTGETTTEYTDKGTRTNELETNKATIAKVIIKNIGTQTVFKRL